MSLFTKSLYRYPLSLSLREINLEKHLQSLLNIEEQCFPAQMRASRLDFESSLKDEYSIGGILYRDNKPIGYLLGSHISELNSEDILATNRFIQEHQDFILYIDSIAILPEERSLIVFDFLIHEMHTIIHRFDYKYLTCHARKRNGFSRILQRRFGAVILANYANWNECNEPFDYLLIDISKYPRRSRLIRFAFNILQSLRNMRLRAGFSG